MHSVSLTFWHCMGSIACKQWHQPRVCLKLVVLQVAKGNNGKPADVNKLKLVPLLDRQLCDGCASCIADVHRSCKACGYDACMRCCSAMRKQGKVRPVLWQQSCTFTRHFRVAPTDSSAVATLCSIKFHCCHRRCVHDSSAGQSYRMLNPGCCPKPLMLDSCVSQLVAQDLHIDVTQRWMRMPAVCIEVCLLWQEVMCGKCEKPSPLYLVRRFTPTDDTSLAAIDEVCALELVHASSTSALHMTQCITCEHTMLSQLLCLTM